MVMDLSRLLAFWKVACSFLDPVIFRAWVHTVED
jgi:hypothetical protein